MKITKTDAQSVALKMTEKKQKEIEVIKKELSDYAYQIAKSFVRKDIMDFYEKHPNYFKTIERIQVSGKNVNCEVISFDKKVPSTETYQQTRLVTDVQGLKISQLLNNKKILKEERDKLYVDIENALVSLGSYTRINEQFKEAVPFLPFKQKSEIVINLNDIRKRI